MLEALLDIVFPPLCGGCRERGSWLCERCALSVRPAPLTACKRCRRLISLDPCPMCEAGEGPESMIAMARLEGPLREALHRLKYGDRPQLAVPIVAATLLQRRLAPGIMVPVPLHPARRHRRGYNQAELLVRGVAGRAGASWTDALERVGRGAPQVGRRGAERREALAGAFRWRPGHPVPAAVVIVDDVLTTGATLLDCCLAARAAGVKRVEALAIALG